MNPYAAELDRRDVSRCPHREWHYDATPRDDDGAPLELTAPGETGTSYANALWCRKWGAFISPKGVACVDCHNRTWPDIERWRAHVLPPAAPDKRADLIVAAVARGDMSQEEALKLGDEFNFS